MRQWGLTLAMVPLLVSCGQADKDAVRCEILQDYVSRWFDGSPDQTKFLSETPEGLTYGKREIGTMAKVDAREQSDFLILSERIELAGRNPLDECPELRSLREARSYKPANDDRSKTVDADGFFYGFETLSISMPGVDLATGRAGFDIGTVCGPLCGSGAFVTYRRTPLGNWILDDEEPTWIS